MKKIFTLIFSLGLLTAAFAQGGHHQRDYNSNIGSGNQSWSQNDQKNFEDDQRYQATPYSNSNDWNYQSKDQKDQYGYGKEVKTHDDFGGRDHMKSDNDRFDDKRFSKGMNKRHSETYRRKSGLQISFDFGHDHK
jgi:hypothetical protein